MEDIEDLFNEDFKETETPLVVPEFGPCATEDGQEEQKVGQGKAISGQCC